MTIKELYDIAKEKDMENAELYVNYECHDDWYSLREERVKTKGVEFRQGDQEIIINM